MSCIFNEVVVNFTEVNFITTKNYHHREKTQESNFIGKCTFKKLTLKTNFRSSLVVQQLGLHVFTAKGLGSIPGQETKILQAMQHGKGKKNKKKIILFQEKNEKSEHLCLKQLQSNIFFFIQALEVVQSLYLIVSRASGQLVIPCHKSLSSISHAVVFKYLVTKCLSSETGNS